MFSVDREALICDLAETYHIYDYKSLPCSMVAIFACGLRDNSRIKMIISDSKYPLETILSASIVDKLSLLLWTKTEDGYNGVNKPEMIVNKLLEDDKSDTEGFVTGEDFDEMWKSLGGGM